MAHGGRVQIVQGREDFISKISLPGQLVVVDFSATWCGPCRYIKPIYESMSMEHPDVLFLAVDGDQNGDLCMELGIRGFPTFHFYISGQKMFELVGAQEAAIRSKISELKMLVDSKNKKENVLGGGAIPTPGAKSNTIIDQVLLSQLLDLGFGENRSKKALLAGAANVEQCIDWLMVHQDDPDIDEPPPGSTLNSQAQSATKSSANVSHSAETARRTQTSGDETEQMSDTGSKTKAETAQGEVDGSEQKKEEDEGDVERPDQESEAEREQERSRKADEAATEDAEELARSLSAWEGESRSSPLTAEERQAKVQELRQKIARRRREKEEAEKAAEIDREKKRREMGKQISQTREELETMQRKREAEARRREKLEFKRERDRLRAQIAKDKAERRAHGGKLESRLAASGYHPDVAAAEAGSGDSQDKDNNNYNNNSSSSDSNNRNSAGDPREAVSKAVAAMQAQRVADGGLQALKVLAVYLKNVLEHPREDKFRSINTDNKAFRSRVAPVLGAVALLKAVGFEKNEESGCLVLDKDQRQDALLAFAREKVEQAFREWNNGVGAV